MNLDFLSGLLLATVTLAVVIFLIREVVSVRGSDQKKTEQSSVDGFGKFLGREAKPVNDHLIGSIGKVIAESSDSTRPIRVRLGAELWPARPDSADQAQLSVGTDVKVAAVDGPILVVVAAIDVTESPQDLSHY